MVKQCKGPVTDDEGFIHSEVPEPEVQWEEPIFEDNSGAKLTIYSSSEPGKFLAL